MRIIGILVCGANEKYLEATLKEFEVWKKDHQPIWRGNKVETENLFIERLREKKFTTEQIAIIVSVVSRTCHDCYDNDFDCQCRNDD